MRASSRWRPVIKGAKISVLGAGRSGLAVAKAATKRGATVTVYDEKEISSDAATELAMAGVKSVSGFSGSFHADTTDLIVISPGVPRKHPMLLEAGRHGIEVIGEIEYAFRISEAPIVAITGTNGKSTTTLMTWSCLKSCGQDAVLCGNIFGSGNEEIPLTEAADSSNANQVLVAEISSFQLETAKSFRPKCAAITNISEDHLNRYDNDFTDYANTKRRLFDRMGTGDTIVVDKGNNTTWPSGWQPGKKQYNGAKVRTYDSAKMRTAFAKGNPIPVDDFELESEGYPFKEAFNYSNAAVASLLALSFLSTNRASEERALEKVKAALRAFRPLEHRVERVGSKDGIELINNSMCTNPAAVVASSSGIRARQHLLMGGLTKGSNFAPVAQYLKTSGHQAYLFGAEGNLINEQLGGSFPVFRTMKEAFDYAVRQAGSGDVVMLAPGCASMDQYADFRARGEEFRAYAMEWLNR